MKPLGTLARPAWQRGWLCRLLCTHRSVHCLPTATIYTFTVACAMHADLTPPTTVQIQPQHLTLPVLTTSSHTAALQKATCQDKLPELCHGLSMRRLSSVWHCVRQAHAAGVCARAPATNRVQLTYTAGATVGAFACRAATPARTPAQLRDCCCTLTPLATPVAGCPAAWEEPSAGLPHSSTGQFKASRLKRQQPRTMPGRSAATCSHGIHACGNLHQQHAATACKYPSR